MFFHITPYFYNNSQKPTLKINVKKVYHTTPHDIKHHDVFCVVLFRGSMPLM